MKKIILFSIVFLTFAPFVFSQKIEINEPPIITEMTEKWAAQNRTNSQVEGWRVQLFSSTDRRAVEDAKAGFLRKYPNIPCDWVQEKPYYKLRVGAFLTKIEAKKLITDLENDYPGAYATKVRDIHLRDFVEM